MFGDIGIEKLLMLLVIFLLLFGAKRIPEIGRSLGKGIREFKGSLSGLEEPAESLALREAPGGGTSTATVIEPNRGTEPLRRLNS